MVSLSDLGKLAKKDIDSSSKFVKWERKTTEEGDEISGKWLPIKGKILEYLEPKEMSYQGQKARTMYPIAMEIDGVKKELGASAALIRELVKKQAEAGTTVIMVRTGEQKETKYDVKVV